MTDLSQYKPGQLITSMTRRAFLDLWQEIQAGVIQKRWPEGKVAQTKRERTEEARVRVLVMIFKEYPDTFEMLLASDEWLRIEAYMGKDGLVHFRALKDQTEELERVKALRRTVAKRRL